MNFDSIIEAMRAAGCSETQILDTIQNLTKADRAQRRAKVRDRVARHRANSVEAVTLVTDVTPVTQKSVTPTGAHIEHAPARVEDNPPTEGNNNPPVPLRGTPPPARKRATRIPDDWEPDMQVALDEGLTWAEGQREAAKFRDHFVGAPGQKGLKMDWPATWRNWCRRAGDDKRQRRPRGADPPKRGSAALIDALENG